MYQCGDWRKTFSKRPVDAYHESLNIAVQFYANFEFIACTVFFSCVFWLRDI